MFIFWGITSWIFLCGSLFGYFWLRKIIFFSWVILELITWRIFFFFSLTFSKTSQQNLYTFFLLQRATSILWLTSQYLLERLEKDFSFKRKIFMSFLIVLLLFMKIGLFPGHIWRWQIYLTQQIWPIFLISTLQKIFPIIILRSFRFFQEDFDLLKWGILIGMWLVLFHVRSSFYFFSFVFLSGILHYNRILLLNLFGFNRVSRVYIFRYWGIFLLVLFLVEEKKFFSFNPEDRFEKRRRFPLIFWVLILGGFPPRLIFFFKYFFFRVLKNSLFSPFLFITLLTFFLYLINILLSRFRKFFSFSIWNVQGERRRTGFLFFIQDFYFLFRIFIFYSGFLFFII